MNIITLLIDVDLSLIEHGRYGGLPRNIFQYLPMFISNNSIIVYSYIGLDNFLGLIFNLFNQNHYFVAKK